MVKGAEKCKRDHTRHVRQNRLSVRGGRRMTTIILIVAWCLWLLLMIGGGLYFKRKHEELANMPLPKPTMPLPKPTVTSHKVDTLKFQRSYPADLIIMGGEDKIKSIFTRDLVDDLVSQMDKYVTVMTLFEPHKNCYRIAGEVKIVRAESEDRNEDAGRF
jgi:hypothetical protein